MSKKSTQVAESRSSLQVDGNVTLKYMSGKKLIKTKKLNNSATMRLLQGLALYLCRASGDEFLPAFMGVGSNNQLLTPDESLKRDSLMNEYSGRRVVLTRHSPEITDDGYKAPFSATFPSSLIGSENPIGEFGLFSTLSSNSMLARVVLSELEYIPAGLTLIVEWNINVSNQRDISVN